MSKQVIICVDDEMTVLSSLKMELKNTFGNQYIIEIAEGGDEAIELIQDLLENGYEIPLIICDYLMPGMKGDELLTQVHQLSPKTLKVMLTGQAAIEAVKNAINYANLYRYISKPWQEEDMKLTVTEAIYSYFQDKKLAEKNAQLLQMNQELESLNREQAALITKLNENERRLQKFLEAMPVAVLVANATGEAYYINSRAQELLGKNFNYPAVNSQQLTEIYQFYLEGTDQLYPDEEDILHRALKGEKASADNIEIHGERKNISIEAWGTPIYLEEDHIDYALLVFQDISQRKQAEKILANYNKTLEKQVQQRTLDLEKANLELERLASLDELTQVANRRKFDEYLANQWQQMSLEKKPLSLILCDVDFFKKYNDCYGHQGGDDCLKQLAKAMSYAVETASTFSLNSKLVARYGGEEFAIIVPGVEAEKACAVAEAIRGRVQQLKIPHAKSKINKYVTLSLGVASVFPHICSLPKILIATADQALYDAKKQGRDRLVMKKIIF